MSVASKKQKYFQSFLENRLNQGWGDADDSYLNYSTAASGTAEKNLSLHPWEKRRRKTVWRQVVEAQEVGRRIKVSWH